MKNQRKNQSILKTALSFFITLVFLSVNSYANDTQSPDPNQSSKYLDAVREFADNVLKYGRDTYGPKNTPLFVDGLNVNTHEPVKWIATNGDEWILSNLSSQQNLFRTLDSLTKITGDPKYKKAAMDAIKYAFENLRTPNGLLYWGGHSAYDAASDKPCGRDVHELKEFYPYYELMWEVDPNITKQFIEAFWAGHVLDWSNLDFDRHCYKLTQPLPKAWDYEYIGGPVFFKSKGGLSFVNTGSDLCYAATLLTKLSGDKEPLIWGRRLAYRYVEARNPQTGINPGVFTGNITSGTYVFPFSGHSNSIIWPNAQYYRMPTPRSLLSGVTGRYLCQLLLGGLLGNEGQDFTQYAHEELTAIGKICYRRQDNVYIPTSRDGTSMEGYLCTTDGPFGPKGSRLLATPALPSDFWAYAVAYCRTNDLSMWEMAREIARGNTYGDIGMSPTEDPQLNYESLVSDPYGLLGFLELHSKTGNKAFLKMAEHIATKILDERFYDGFFVGGSDLVFCKFDAIDSLALLHLFMSVRGQSGVKLPQVWPSTSFFDMAYRNKEEVIDNLIYAQHELPLPMSLQEAAAIGDFDLVRSLVAKGADIDGREDTFLKTALHHAAINGHREIAEFLLAKGANVNAKDDFPGGTPLHYAVESGSEDIVKVLIDNGADINIKNNNGQTPLDIAMRRNHKEIIELLRPKVDIPSIHVAAQLGDLNKVKVFLDQGIDVNVKDESGMTPLLLSVTSGHADVVKLLIENGADVNTGDAQGFTPLLYALMNSDPNTVKLLLNKGADVKAKDTALGFSVLHWAILMDNKESTELVLAAGADVNGKSSTGETPLDVAAYGVSTAIGELLLEKGAEVSSLHTAAYVGDLDKVKAFIDEGADVKQQKGMIESTALHAAAASGHKEVVEFLIGKGSDVNAQNRASQTPLHIAAENGHLEVVQLLLDNGADVNAKDRRGQTPMDLAIPRRNTAVIETLSKYSNNTDSDKPYVVLERGDVRAVIINNEPIDDEVLPRHRGGYSGVASLTHRTRDKNLFVPFYAGLNFEHIHDGTNQPIDILFEPRRAPMEIKRIDEHTAELYQPPTPHWQLESWLRYRLLEDGAIEMILECIPSARTFKNDYIGLFFASYIDKPESLDIHFLGCPADQINAEPRWIRGVTPEHGVLSTHLGINDNRNFVHDHNFPMTLVFNRSNYRYTEPWYYGVSNGMTLVLMFRPGDNVRLSQSPSGGDDGNPAWDFQWFVPQYKVGQKYRFVMRAMYLPFESQQQIIQATTRHRAALE